MPLARQLNHIIKLLDDDSVVVREAVQQQLAGIHHELPAHLDQLERPLTDEEERIVAQLLEPVRRTDLEETWMRWRWQARPDEQLEMAMAHLSAFLNGWKTRPEDLGRRLDEIAQAAFHEQGRMDARELAEWLFGGRGESARLRGNSRNYYAPENSNLFWVLDNGMGNPISLSCIYRFVARRFGVTVEGCNFPGHFLARVPFHGRLWLVDCFNRGRFMLATDVAKHHPAANPAMEDLVREPAPVDAILLRTLRNLDESYDRLHAMADRQLMRKLAMQIMDE
ncbi:MAG: hypothetical protein K1X78_02825 [Verrucomicrobiaceae bacterium]|nr:hypothetical protein [Verrucomicrobiaceae bacterium]